MILRSVRLENFRAVKSARVSFEPTTVLIGENDCGRSSIMEAIALALGWNCAEGEFRFQPFHAHRAGGVSAAAISIGLEFGESAPGEWDGEGFETLRNKLPDVPGGPRRLGFEVTCAEGVTHWVFESAGGSRLVDDREILGWLRRRMPVFWMTEGMWGVRSAGESAGLGPPRPHSGKGGEIREAELNAEAQRTQSKAQRRPRNRASPSR